MSNYRCHIAFQPSVFRDNVMDDKGLKSKRYNIFVFFSERKILHVKKRRGGNDQIGEELGRGMGYANLSFATGEVIVLNSRRRHSPETNRSSQSPQI